MGSAKFWPQTRIALLVVAAWVAGALMAAHTEAADQYGAIAYSRSTNQCGSSHDFGTRAEAEARALAACGSPDCYIVIWLKDTCGALAVGEGSAIGYGYARTRKAASTEALARCRGSGRKCKILCTSCTR